MDHTVIALGGYFGPDASPVFPRLAVITWTEEGWGAWQQEGGQQRGRDRRSGFMAAEVPLAWVERLCEL